ncbi:hypothetical protein HDU96_005602, partial [Phlyctochytrium bullatum]
QIGKLKLRECKDPIREWPVFSLRVKTALEAAELWYVVHQGREIKAGTTDLDGVAVNPDADANVAAQRVKDDNKAKTLILSKLSDDGVGIVADCESSKEIWMTLRSTFLDTNTNAGVHLRNEMNTVKYRPGTDVALHFSRINQYVTMLKLCGHKVSEDEHVATLLRSIPDDSTWGTAKMVIQSLADQQRTPLTVISVKQQLLTTYRNSLYSQKTRGGGEIDGGAVGAAFNAKTG